jgi:hypothetical protein
MASNRRKALDAKKAAQKARMGKPGTASVYARKRVFLNRNGGFGFHYPDKPWKS